MSATHALTYSPTILVIDDDPQVLRAIAHTLGKQGYTVLTALDGELALELVNANEVHVCLIDMNLPRWNGLEVMRKILEADPHMECIIFTEEADTNIAYRSIQEGASDYFEKPIRDWQRFQQVLRRAGQFRNLRQEKHQLESELKALVRSSSLIGRSKGIEEIRKLVFAVATTSTSVLLEGEPGVGKEVVAEELHRASGRNGRFVSINCANLDANRLESNLFGHEKGAFTGAHQAKPGLFEIAENGTVLLDEVGEMPYELQAQLLRVLESRRFRRMGGTQEKAMSARIVCATNRDLREAIDNKEFREDLLYRINVFTIPIPPLRERPEDIAPLTYFLISKLNESMKRNIRRVPSDFMRKLEQHIWPGNVRELRNVIERTMILCDGESLEVAALPDHMHARKPLVSMNPSSSALNSTGLPEMYRDMPLSAAKEQVVQDLVRRYLVHRLNEAGGNITRAAQASGMQRPNFKREMKKYGVDVPKGDLV